MNNNGKFKSKKVIKQLKILISKNFIPESTREKLRKKLLERVYYLFLPLVVVA